MASAPSIRGSTAPAATLNPTSPASTEIGDMVIVFSWTRGGAGVPTHTLQSGFVEFPSTGGSISHDDGSTDGRLSAAYKIATSAGANGYQAYTSSGSDVWSGIIVLTKGTFRTTDIVAAGVSQTNNAVPNPAQVTGLTSTLNYRIIVCAAWHLGSAATVTVGSPSNYTEEWEVAGSQTSELSAGTRTFTGATSEDPGGFTDDVAPNGTCCTTIAIPEYISVAGVIAATATVAGTMLSKDMMAGAIAASATVTGGLTVGAAVTALAGQIDAVATVSGSMLSKDMLAGEVAATAALAGALSVEHALAGSIDASATVAGTMLSKDMMAGSIDAIGAAAGSLSVEHPLAGAIAGAASVAGALSVEHTLAGSVAGAADVVGVMSVEHTLTGTVAGTGAVDGALSVAHTLAGAVAAQAVLAGDLRTAGLQACSGTIAALAALEGALSVTRPVAGEVAGAADLAGDLAITRGLAGAIAGMATLSGSAGLTVGLAGEAAITAAVAGALRVLRGLSGSVESSVEVEGHVHIVGAPALPDGPLDEVATEVEALGQVGGSRIALGVVATTEE